MKNIFILYIPSSNYEAVVHYEDTIVKKVSQERIFKYIDLTLKNHLKRIFFDKKIAVWGSRNTEANRAKYEKMKIGDELLIVEGNNIKLLGKIAAKTINSLLSRELWKNLKGTSSEGWDLIYFIANPQEVNLSFTELNKLFGYEKSYRPRGFTTIQKDKVESFYNKYDDFYSILLRLKSGEKVKEIDKSKVEDKNLKDDFAEDLLKGDNFKQLTKEFSDHILMQWSLIELGLKSKTNVWIPKNDQKKIKEKYHFNNFEEKFITGLDVPIKYINNIDCIWKEEFKIHAAFEVENTTEIYSGLLRFSDLMIAAPNSSYPMYIVSPVEKKNKLVEQLKRPTFKKLELHKRVKYLSYENLRSIYGFFNQSPSGMNLEVLDSRSESIPL